jgi:hypothetical protein
MIINIPKQDIGHLPVNDLIDLPVYLIALADIKNAFLLLDQAQVI